MDAVEQIKQKLDIVDVINKYVSLKKSGKNYKANCPFHSENSPSFMVAPDLQFYRCFGCGETGDMFTFVQKIEGLDFVGALKILAEQADITLPEYSTDNKQNKEKKEILKINLDAQKFFSHVLLKHKLGVPGLTYLKEKRHLKTSTIEDFGLGFACDSWSMLGEFLVKKGYSNELIEKSGLVVKKPSGGYYDKFRGRIVFPLREIDGTVVGFTGRDILGQDPKYLNSPETAAFKKHTYIYALDKAKLDIKKKGIIFVEGQMDVLSAHEFGFKNVVASSGTAITSDQLQLLSRYSKELIFCFDSDLAGVNAVARALELCEKFDFNVKVIVIPAPYKDLDEFLRGDFNLAQEVINNPISIYDFFVFTTLKKYNKKDALDKKRILHDLHEWFFKVKNPVILDHYINLLAKELEISVDSIKQVWNDSTPVNSSYNVKKVSQTVTDIVVDKEIEDLKNSAEAYLLALLLKADVDITKTILYKLGQRDFYSEQLLTVFSLLKEYTQQNFNAETENKSFDFAQFNTTLSKDLQKTCEFLYLWDFSVLLDDKEHFYKEIKEAFVRVKVTSIKRQMELLSEQIKQSEKEKNLVEVKNLLEEFNKLSSKLSKINYGK